MTFFGILGTAFVGLIVGAIAGWLSPGREPRGCLATILVGVAGAFVARWLGNAVFGWYSDGSARLDHVDSRRGVAPLVVAGDPGPARLKSFG